MPKKLSFVLGVGNRKPILNLRSHVSKMFLLKNTNCHYNMFSSIKMIIDNQCAYLGSVLSSTVLYKGEHFSVKNHVFHQKSQISGIFKKSVLDFKDTVFRLLKHVFSEMH